MSPTKMTVFDELMRNITLKDHIDSLKGEIEDVKKNALFKKEQDYRLMETLRKDLIRFSSTQFQHNKRLRERVLNCQPSCLKKTDNAQRYEGLLVLFFKRIENNSKKSWIIPICDKLK